MRGLTLWPCSRRSSVVGRTALTTRLGATASRRTALLSMSKRREARRGCARLGTAVEPDTVADRLGSHDHARQGGTARWVLAAYPVIVDDQLERPA